MSIPIGKRNLVVYGISGTAYGVKQNTDVVYREEYVDFHANLTHHFHRILTHPCS